MRVLMLGWEFPPFISGGLGTACYGLTKALDRLGHEITFVLPKAVDKHTSSHVQLLSPEAACPIAAAEAEITLHVQNAQDVAADLADGSGQSEASEGSQDGTVLPIESSSGSTNPSGELRGFKSEHFSENVTFHAVPSQFASPYGDGGPVDPVAFQQLTTVERTEFESLLHSGIQPDVAMQAVQSEGVMPVVRPTSLEKSSMPPVVPDISTPTDEPDLSQPTPGFLGLSKTAGEDYGGDLMGDTQRYAQLVLGLTRGQQFDVIHAHDWMTFPAGMAVARLTGTPLVIHQHSTEFDRAGNNVNQKVYDIERRGMHSAMRIITVSYWTRNIVIHRYGVDPGKIRVVWNGVDQENSDVERPPIRSDDKIVLFLGRITMQKGPEYFIHAAKRVLEKVKNVKFIVAGSGDMATRMIEMAASLGIGHKVLFTGFLRGKDVARVFRMADCYVMPSVSEPFGIAPLEAMSHNVPVIISKQSGVSEVLTHALKVDFWDVDEIANKIVAVLKYPPLSQTMRHHGQFELRHLTWDGAAENCQQVYEEAAAGQLSCV